MSVFPPAGNWSPSADMHSSKWGFWMLHNFVFLVVYVGILVLPYTKWRDRLPAKPSFYRYVALLAMMNLLGFLGGLPPPLPGCRPLPCGRP